MKINSVSKLPRIEKRRVNTNKGDYGKVLIVAGSLGMAGAAYLACKGAYRSGAGLVYLAIPKGIYDVVGAKLTCTVIHSLDQTVDGSISEKALGKILQIANNCDSVAIGPGLSQNANTGKLVTQLIRKLSIPFVLDADGLNLISKYPQILKEAKVPVVITPHQGELSRIMRVPVSQIEKDREGISVRAANTYKIILVLKGHNTIVTDGKRVYKNPTGNPGMATGGSGDVLTGMIATFLAQGVAPFNAAQLAVYIHGFAGDLAAKNVGEVSMLATDILGYLPTAFKLYQSR
ncbi:MAG: NAD(P)H-hydrate dehydratase [Candidatus Schekmanbacteria bacterium RBG_16_38_10]|uniref:ADP-dependent (S)-NAD(P)H-hydrate dehydratase n=1 Tax=Candidatus Schekmanbacteria bacterium RBG_16_38_10 TaxID=1817879 RepID=A0A1F7S0B1_9BACT|nr:MAG: NAD(P)H-hydrate dehydratase [Candidatus Schekmanbacteria bacterium RBG_16_38_10]